MKKSEEHIQEINEYIKNHQEEIREIAKEIVARRLILQAHFGLWLGTNLLLVLIFILTQVPLGVLGWTAIPWGFAVMLHAFNFVVFRNGWLKDWNEYAYAYTVFLFVTVSALLAFIDFMDDPDRQFKWYFWSLMGMGIFFVVHTIIFLLIRSQANRQN
jgi:hypothetical protein